MNILITRKRIGERGYLMVGDNSGHCTSQHVNSFPVPSDEALPSLAVPFRNDSQTFSLPFVIPGHLPLRIWTFSSAEKKGRFRSYMVRHGVFLEKLRPDDPIASSWNCNWCADTNAMRAIQSSIESRRKCPLLRSSGVDRNQNVHCWELIIDQTIT